MQMQYYEDYFSKIPILKTKDDLYLYGNEAARLSYITKV